MTDRRRRKTELDLIKCGSCDSLVIPPRHEDNYHETLIPGGSIDAGLVYRSEVAQVLGSRTGKSAVSQKRYAHILVERRRAYRCRSDFDASISGSEPVLANNIAPSHVSRPRG